MDTLQDRLEQDIADLITGLNLLSLGGGTADIKMNVVIQNELEKLAVQTWPTVIITCQGQSEEEADGSFEEDYVTYPVYILICDKSRTQFQKPRHDYLRWRHDIAQTLRGLVNYNKGPNFDSLLPNCRELQDVRVRMGPIFPDNAAMKEIVQQGLVAHCQTTELRKRG